MIFGAFKRTTTVELASYLICATAAVALGLLAPNFTSAPDWLLFLVFVGVQLGLYRRFYGRL